MPMLTASYARMHTLMLITDAIYAFVIFCRCRRRHADADAAVLFKRFSHFRHAMLRLYCHSW